MGLLLGYLGYPARLCELGATLAAARSPTSSLHPRAEYANPGWCFWRTNDVEQKRRTRQGYGQRGPLCDLPHRGRADLREAARS
jgi:hypothetical protein